MLTSSLITRLAAVIVTLVAALTQSPRRATAFLEARPGGAHLASSASPAAPRARSSPMAAVSKPSVTVRIMMTGDVMLGRGVDQTLPDHVDPRIYESWIKDARDYTKLAEQANGPLPPNRGYDYPWGFALEDMSQMQPDVRLINLETALTTHDTPWPQKGINYRCHPGNVGVLSSAGIQVCSLANNHVMDWRVPGLVESLDTLEGAGIQSVGAGRNASQARRPAIVQLPAACTHQVAGAPAGPAGASSLTSAACSSVDDGRPTVSDQIRGGGAGRVLIWAIGHESSGVPDEWEAGESSPGVFMTNLSRGDVKELSQLLQADKRPGRDVAVVSVHWGGNWGFNVPQEQQRFAHALIDEAGVDVVHGHSSHHAKGLEVYHGKLILYGAGDLISDYEGIRNDMVEARYPSDQHRDDVGLLWYADISVTDGTLKQLTMTPTRLRHIRLEPPDPGDWRYIEATMDREARRLGAKGRVSKLPMNTSAAPAGAGVGSNSIGELQRLTLNLVSTSSEPKG